MPELPEVETTKRGLEPLIVNQVVERAILYRDNLRWEMPKHLVTTLANQRVNSIHRRGKYLLIEFDVGTLIIHLGMSGSLRILDKNIPPAKHDHVDIVLSNSQTIRFNDARRFGSIHWTTESINQHRLLAHLGIEPLSEFR